MNTRSSKKTTMSTDGQQATVSGVTDFDTMMKKLSEMIDKKAEKTAAENKAMSEKTAAENKAMFEKIAADQQAAAAAQRAAIEAGAEKITADQQAAAAGRLPR